MESKKHHTIIYYSRTSILYIPSFENQIKVLHCILNFKMIFVVPGFISQFKFCLVNVQYICFRWNNYGNVAPMQLSNYLESTCICFLLCVMHTSKTGQKLRYSHAGIIMNRTSKASLRETTVPKQPKKIRNLIKWVYIV